MYYSIHKKLKESTVLMAAYKTKRRLTYKWHTELFTKCQSLNATTLTIKTELAVEAAVCLVIRPLERYYGGKYHKMPKTMKTAM